MAIVRIGISIEPFYGVKFKAPYDMYKAAARKQTPISSFSNHSICIKTEKKKWSIPHLLLSANIIINKLISWYINHLKIYILLIQIYAVCNHHHHLSQHCKYRRKQWHQKPMTVVKGVIVVPVQPSWHYLHPAAAFTMHHQRPHHLKATRRVITICRGLIEGRAFR